MFRLRDRKKDGQLVVDFDLRALTRRGSRRFEDYAAYVAKVSGTGAASTGRRSSRGHRLIVARVDARPRCLRVVGLFCVTATASRLARTG